MPVSVKYVGHHDEVSIPLGDGQALTVKRGHTVSVPDDLAGGPVKGVGLLAQTDSWERADSKKEAPKDEPMPVNRTSEPAPAKQGG